jgi:hypothetical protein
VASGSLATPASAVRAKLGRGAILVSGVPAQQLGRARQCGIEPHCALERAARAGAGVQAERASDRVIGRDEAGAAAGSFRR